MFQSARLTLTAWYILIAVIITGYFSIFAYRGFGLEVERGIQREQIVIEQQLPSSPGSPPNLLFRRIDPGVVQEVRWRILMRILLIDASVIFVAALGGYFLAGRTLRPIKLMHDEQNRFIADASHELRTPLTAARTSIEVGLRDKKMTLSQAKELLTSTLEEVNNIQLLSDNLLLLAQVENGSAKNAFETLLLNECIQEAKEKVAPLAKEKSQQFTISGEKHHIYGYKERIIALFIILFENAVKYSEKRTAVSVNIAKNDGSVIVKVSDQGIGIAKEDLPHIFDRFYRAEKSRTKSKASGYGLGLSIAKKIVEDHDGSIAVDSTVGEGTTFTIKLPLKQTKKDA